MKKTRRFPSIVLLAAVLLAGTSVHANNKAGKGDGAKGPAGPAAPAVKTGTLAPGAGVAKPVALPGSAILSDVTGASAVPALDAAAAADVARPAIAPQAAPAGSAPLSDTDAAANGAAALEATAAAARVADVRKANGVLSGARAWLKRGQADDGGVAASASSASDAPALSPAAQAAAVKPESSVPAPGDQGGSNWKADPVKGKALKTAAAAAVIGGAAYEILSMTMTPYLQNTFKDFSLAAELGIMGSLASIIGRQIGPLIVNRSTLRGGYQTLTRPVIYLASALAALVALTPLFTSMGLPSAVLLSALFGLMFFFRGYVAASAASERAIPPQVLEQDGRKLETFKGWKQQWLEVGSTWTQVIGGALLIAGASLSAIASTITGAIGFGAVTINPIVINFALAPILFFVAYRMVSGIVIPPHIEAARAASQAAAREKERLEKQGHAKGWKAALTRMTPGPVGLGVLAAMTAGLAASGAWAYIAVPWVATALGKTILRNFLLDIKGGIGLVLKNDILRNAFIISAITMLVNVAVYGLLTPAYGFFATFGSITPPDGQAGLAGPAIGLMAGLFSFGGLYAGRLINRDQKRMDAQMAEIERRHMAAGDSKDEASAKAHKEIFAVNRKSTLKWLFYAAGAMLLLGTMALPLPAIAPLIGPATLAAWSAAVHIPAWMFVPIALAVGALSAIKFPKVGLALVAIPTFLAFPLNVALVASAFFALGLVMVVAMLKNDTLYETSAPAAMVTDAQGAIGAGSMAGGMLGLMGLKFLFSGKLPFGIGMPIEGFKGLDGLAAFGAIGVGGAVLGALIALAAWRLIPATRPRP